MRRAGAWFAAGVASLCFAAIAAGPAAAQGGPQVTASIDRTQVVVNEPFLVTIRAQGNRVAEPVIPHSQDIRFHREPAFRTNSTSVQIVNGQAITVEIRQRTYRAWALRAGALTLPRIEVRIDGQTYLTDELEITAVEASAPVAQPQQPQRGTTPGAGTAGGLRQATLGDVVRIEAEVDKKRVYVGEQVTLTLRILELAMAGAAASYHGRSIPLPTTEGFYSGALEENRLNDRRDGLLYRVNEYRQHLYPAREGNLTVGAWVWEGTVRAYTGSTVTQDNVRVETKPIEVEVRPLPPAPDGFTGAVGNFSVRVNVRDREVQQGVPTVLTIQVEGQGNPDAISAPPLPEMPWAHVGQPEVEVARAQPGQRGRAAKTFTYALTPHAAGDHEVPAMDFFYFEPRLNNYRADTSRPIPLRVTPSPEAGRLVAVGGVAGSGALSVDVRANELMPIIAQARALAPARGGRALNTAAALAPPLLCGAFLAWVARQRRIAADPRRARDRAAWSKTRKRLAELESAADPVEALFRAVAEYLGDKFHVESVGMTAQDARALLRERGVDEALSETIVRILRGCERARYAATPLGPGDFGALAASAADALDELDAYIRQERGR